MTDNTRRARSDLWGGAGWIAFGLLIVAESLRMDRFTAMGAVVYSMPGFVPGIFGSVIALLGLGLVMRGWLAQRSAARRQGDKHIAQDLEAPTKAINPRVVVTLVLTLVYAGLLIGRVPFWLCTAAFVAIFTWWFTPAEHTPMRRAVSALLAGVLTTAVVIGVFQYVFLVRLP